MRHLLIPILILLPTLLFAQEFTFRQEFDTIPVEINNWQPHCPWIGGLHESSPDFVDIDGDNDLDLYIGENSGYVRFTSNQGNSVSADFTWIMEGLDSLYALGDGWHSGPEFYDIDNDDDFDAFIGSGYVTYLENIGTSTSTNFLVQRDTLFDTRGNWVFGTRVAIVDIDGDNDGDLFGGEWLGHIQFYRNIGNSDSASFYLEDSLWLGITGIDYADPAFIDIDNDNDFDLFIGEENGRIWYYQNIGDSLNYDYQFITDTYYGIDVGEDASPEFADIDGDGDFDLFVGRDDVDAAEYSPGDIYFYENIGTPDSAIWQLVTWNYLCIDEGENALNVSADINADSDYDLFAANRGNSMTYFRNTGTPTEPLFQWVTSGYQGITVNACSPFFCDINNDQAIDLFVGEGVLPNPPYPGLHLFQNTGTPQNASFTLISDDLVPWDYHVNIKPALVDIDADGDDDLFMYDADGEFYYCENYGSPHTPSFSSPIENWQNLSAFWGRRIFFFDLDEDDDFDLFRPDGEYGDAYILMFRNTGTAQIPMFDQIPDTLIRVQSGGIGFEGIDILDIDDDGDGDFFIGTASNGGILFFRNTTGDTSAVNPPLIQHPLHGIEMTFGPNPANPVGVASFELRVASFVNLGIYDICGRLVKPLASDFLLPGSHQFRWDAEDAASGVYVLRLQAGEVMQAKRVVVLR